MATYLLIDKTGNALKFGSALAWYNTERGAKISATKLLKKTGVQYTPVTYEEFETKHNTLVEVISLLSGKPVMIRKSEVGTCMDVSMERYWCQ